MPGETLRWGILGTGHIVHDFLQAMQKGERNHQVVAIGASSLERSQKFASENGYKCKTYGSYLEVLEDSEVEVVYIGLRNAEHFEYTMKALDSHKHVLCEKPLGVNGKQVESMVNKARAKKLFLMQGFWSQFFPVYKRIREIIESKELGAPRLVNATFGYSLPESFVNLDRGETMLTCLGCYTIMFAQYVFGGKPQDFTYTGGQNSKGADAWTNLHLKYGENKDAILLFDERHFLPNDAFIGFEHGCIKIHGNFWCPTEMTITRKEEKTTETFPLNDDRKFIYPNSSGLRYEADHVYDRIKGGHSESDIMPLSDIQTLQNTVDAVRKKMKIEFPQDKMYIYDLMRSMNVIPVNGLTVKKASKRSALNAKFFQEFQDILKIMVPGWFSREVGIIGIHSAILMSRTFLSIFVAALEGRIIKAIVQKNVSQFSLLMLKWFLVAVPACAINSLIRFFDSYIGLVLRKRLVQHAYAKYFQNDVYYKVSNLDTRLLNVDQCLTEDITTLSNQVAHLYSQITKPLFDIGLITFTLINYAKKREVGSTVIYPVILAIVIVSGTARILKMVSPRFDNLVSHEAELKGRLRYLHSRIITNSEEISFMKGHEVEHGLLKRAYHELTQQSLNIYKKRIPYIAIEQFLMKYLWSGTGMLMLAIPILFTHNTKIDNDPDGGVSERTRGFTMAKSLLYSSADAAERLMLSYKEVNELAGYTSRVHQMFRVIDDVSKNRYERIALNAEIASRPERFDTTDIKGRVIAGGDCIEAQNLSIVTPNGDLIVRGLNIKIDTGMHLLITGPNGCGKSSFLRIIGNLWPVYEGILKRPASQMCFIPQRPYMTLGTLRDQIIYPDTLNDMSSKNVSDLELLRILQVVHLSSIVDREGGLDARCDWMDVLSGGEKQRLGMARVLYHRPLFALLDECTSAVSIDVEGAIYEAIKSSGVTLLTVSHRPSLWQFHTHLLRYNGEGEYTFGLMETPS